MDFNNDFIAACFVSYGFALLLNQNKSYLQGATRAAFGLRNKLVITNSPLFGESCICFLLLWDFILLWGVECWLLLICCGAALGATERTKPFNCKSKGRKKKKVWLFQADMFDGKMATVSSEEKMRRLSTNGGKQLQSVTASFILLILLLSRYPLQHFYNN